MNFQKTDNAEGLDKGLSRKAYLFFLPWTLSSQGGVNQVVENLFRQMKHDKQYQPMLMVDSWADKRIRSQVIKGYNHYFLRIRNPWDTPRKLINLVAFILYLADTFKQLLGFIRDNNIRVINAHYCRLSMTTFCLLKIFHLFRGKLILSFHGLDVLAIRKAKGIEKLLWKWIFCHVDYMVTCSDSLKKDLLDFNKNFQKKIIPVHNGIDIQLIHRKEDKEYRVNKVLNGKTILLNIGTFESKKGQDILLKAFTQIPKEFPEVHLVFVGRTGNMLSKLKVLIRSLGLTDQVWIYENLPHENISAFLKKATVFILPSRYEPFGIVILEAGAFEIPVIASSVGGVCEILSHGRNGRLFEPEDVESLANEIRYLLNNPDVRIQLGRALKKHVSRNFSWNNAYRKYIELAGS